MLFLLSKNFKLYIKALIPPITTRTTPVIKPKLLIQGIINALLIHSL